MGNKRGARSTATGGTTAPLITLYRLLGLLTLAALGVLTVALVSLAATPPPNTGNPDLTARCGGLKIMLVLDHSGSIGSNAPQVRSAATAFVNGLENTGSSVAVVQFDTTATQEIASYQTIDSTFITNTWTPYIAGTSGGYDTPNGFTNWQDALVKAQGIQTSDGKADLVVFITDGEPNRTGAAGTVATPDTALANALAVSNPMLAAGTHFLMVGVGDALTDNSSFARLEAMSGSELLLANASNVATADVVRIPNFSDLQGALANLADALCDTSITVIKKVDGGNGYQPAEGSAEGWEFTASDPVAGDGFTWTAGPKLTTDAAGATFEWKLTPKDVTSNVTITETPQSGSEMTGVTCDKLDVVADLEAGSFTVSGIAYKDHITCTVKNKGTTPPVVPPTVSRPAPTVDLKVTKAGVVSGQSIVWTVVVSNEGTGQADAVKLAETIPAGLTITNGPSLSQGAWIPDTKVWDVGQILAGKSATMIVTTSAGAAGGTFTNAVIVDAQNETGTKDNNTAAASVTVAAAPAAPLTPPTVKPKPKPIVKPAVCAILAVGKKSVVVGKASGVKVSTKRAGNALVGAVVVFKGAGVYKLAKTGQGGVVVVSVKAPKPGIIRVSVAGKKMCAGQRLGVIGSFEPPVTG